MCCILHGFTNVGQVVKNLFPETFSLSIAVQVAWRLMTINGERIGTKLGELRSRTIVDAG